MLVKKISAILVLCSVMVAGVQAGGHSGGGKWMKKLNLSEEQAVQLKELKSEQRLQMKESVADRKAMKEKGLVLLDQYSEPAAIALADEAAQLARQTTLARLQHMQKIYIILNDEQKQKFKKMMAKEHSKGHKRK